MSLWWKGHGTFGAPRPNVGFALNAKLKEVQSASVRQAESAVRESPLASLGLDQSQLRALGLLPQPSILQPLVKVPTVLPESFPVVVTDRSSLSVIPKRADAPVLLPSAGVKRKLDHGIIDRASFRADLDKDVVANSSQSSQKSLAATWSRFHQLWYGPAASPFPLSPEAIRDVASVFKRNGYRSYPNYLSAAKRTHIAAGFVWDQQMDLASRDTSRSVARGLGPARQSAELDVDRIGALKCDGLPLVAGGPLNPVIQFVLGAFFLMREIELSCALFRNVAIIESGSKCQVKWMLPASKTDPSGSSVTRTWGCLCNSSPVCPAHLAETHIRVMKARFGTEVVHLPLFPDAVGNFVCKSKVVGSFEQLALRLGEPLIDDLGRNRVGGHSARVSGARHLANMGLELYKLAVLARWSSPVLLRYVGEAPLKTITSDCQRLLAGQHLHKILQETKDLLQDQRLPNLREEVRSLIDAHPLVSKIAAAVEVFKFVVNTATSVIHRIDHDPLDPFNHSSEVVTLCGWKARRSVCTFHHGFPDEVASLRPCGLRGCFG